MKTVIVIGIWHLGSVNAVGFAKLGFNVIGLEFDDPKISQFNRGQPPLYEPGLEEAFKQLLKEKKLSFSSDPSVVEKADYAVIAYDSPVNDKDEVDITHVRQAALKIAPYLKPDVPIIITSQVPLGTSQKIENEVKIINHKWQSGVVYSPENLNLGNAIERFIKPDMLVLGANNQQALKAAQKLYQLFATNKITMDLKSAEMVKHALNVFLATSITFGNEIANIAERLGADAVAVAKALKLDQRVAKAPILPGLGFSGGTLARDVKQLKKFSKTIKYKAPLINSILIINEASFDQIIFKLKKALSNFEGKTIGVLGLTYKPGTSTLRRSPAIKLTQKLVAQKAQCLGYDPMASQSEFIPYQSIIKRVKSPYQLAEKSDAIVLVTEWSEFQKIDYKKLADKMKKPILIDSKNFLDPVVLTQAGFYWEGFGRKRKR